MMITMISCIPHREDVTSLDNDIVHVHGSDPREVSRDGDQVNGGPLVELEQAGIGSRVPLPPESRELACEHLVRCDHLASGDMHQDLSTGSLARLSAPVIDESNDTILEHPNPRH